MNRLFSWVKRVGAWASVVAMLSVVSVGYAAVKVDLSKGEALFTNGDPVRGIPACVSCHGVEGNSTITQNPKLAGQHAAYIAKQLYDFKGVGRNQPVMTTYAKMLTDEEIKNIAGYVESQKQKPGAAKNKETIDLGKKIYRAGIAEKNVPACAGCHGPNGAGIPAQYPRIGGQHQDYVAAQMTNFSTGTRKNGPQMGVISKRLSEDEIKAVADYVAGLR